MNNHHRFIIYGAGAIGSVFGGMLARAGHQVSLVGRDPHMEVVRNRGLGIDGLLGTYHVKGIETATALEDLKGTPPAGAVFISVKSNATAAAVADLSGCELVNEDTVIASLQNGLGNLEQIQEVFGNDRSFGARVIFGASVTRPGGVHVSVWADKVLLGGPVSERGMRSGQELARLLTESGIETEAVDNIQAALWGKVLYNSGLNPLSALLNVPYGDLGLQENARVLLTLLIREAFSVASREVQLPWMSADDYLAFFFHSLLPPTAAHESSMLQDIMRGRETEIDAITGQVIERANLLDVPAPVSRVIYDLVKAKAAGSKYSAAGER